VSTKTIVGKINWAKVTPQITSGLLGLASVALVAFGIALIYIPAGVIAAGLGCIALQWQFFGDDPTPDDGTYPRR
jgi:hypothetical protein